MKEDNFQLEIVDGPGGFPLGNFSEPIEFRRMVYDADRQLDARIYQSLLDRFRGRKNGVISRVDRLNHLVWKKAFFPKDQQCLEVVFILRNEQRIMLHDGDTLRTLRSVLFGWLCGEYSVELSNGYQSSRGTAVVAQAAINRTIDLRKTVVADRVADNVERDVQFRSREDG